MTAEQHRQIEDYLLTCSRKRFVFGQWDCAIFCGDILAILTGQDFAGPFRGEYKDREGYLNALPCRLDELPEHIGLKPSRPRDGAVWWGAGAHGEGGLGIFWQGRCYQPGRRGLRSTVRDVSKLKFYF